MNPTTDAEPTRELVRYLYVYPRPGGPPGNQMVNEHAQVGETVRLPDGSERVLLAPVDADGYAPVRRRAT